MLHARSNPSNTHLAMDGFINMTSTDIRCKIPIEMKHADSKDKSHATSQIWKVEL